MSDYTLYHGDCLEVLRTLPAESVDAVITDPPYSSGGRQQANMRQLITKNGARTVEHLCIWTGD